MRQKFALPLIITISLFLTACSYQTSRVADRAQGAQPLEPPGLVSLMPMSTMANTPAERFIAVEHKLEVLSSDEKLQAAWDAVIRFCGTPACEVTA